MLAESGLALEQVEPSTAVAMAAGGRAVLCFGAATTADEVRAVLDPVAEGSPAGACLAIVLAGPDAAGLGELIEDEHLFYLANGPLPAPELAALIESATRALDPSASPRTRPAVALPALDRVLGAEALRRLALASSAAALADALSAAAAQAALAERVRCLLFDRERHALWAPAGGGDAAGESPALGLASFALRTGLAVRVERAGDDPRFDRELDDPDGEPGDRLLAVPVAAGDGEVVAVVVALRSPREPAFERRDEAALEALASHAVPYLLPWVPEAEVGDGRPTGDGLAPHLFRSRALAALETPAAAGPDPLRLTPRWTAGVYWLSLALLLVALAAAVLVRIPEYATGVAVVRAGGRLEVTATASGTVSRLAVAPLDEVHRGQVLLALYSAEEAASLDRLERELEQTLVQRLLSPDDPNVAEGLIALRAERELARSRLAEREIRAPADGKVSDVRVGLGQYLAAGQPVLALATGPQAPSIVALVPGHHLPQLARGMKLRLELPGHPYVYRWLELDSVAEEVIGPAEARRLLGLVAGDAVTLDGPLAAVTAALPDSTFEVAGETYAYRDGMQSRAEIRVRSERLLFALVPALRSLGEQPRG